MALPVGLHSEMKKPETEKNIGRYRVEEKLGEGAMSVVYKAHDPEINRGIAIKLLRRSLAAEPEYHKRFVSEAKAAGNLAHANIVTIYDVGECDSGPYIAMELLDGPTLEELMQEKHPFDYREILSIGIQLAEGLGYSHTKGVVHRDVKPGNIIFQGSQKVLRITDFGIARIDTPNEQGSTIAGTILGTPRYMSPEQVEAEEVDGRSDLFSVGVILYQLLTGVAPFSGATLASLYVQITRDEPVSIDRLAADAPVGLRNVIKKLLHKDPARRFQSGKELADALRHVVSELDAAEQRRADTRLMPLRYKWTLILVLLVSIAMTVSAAIIYRKEVAVMTTLALDFGSSLAEFVATESTESLLIQDWVAIELFVKETAEREQISHLQVVDHEGLVRASSNPLEHNKPYVALSPDAQYMTRIGETAIHRLAGEPADVFDFEAPILYQDKSLGRVHLGLSSASLDQAAQVTLYTLVSLLLAVILTVAVVAYLLAARLSVPMRILQDALKHASKGNLAHRISESRNDEFGRMFHQFNLMAEAMEQVREENQVLMTQSGIDHSGEHRKSTTSLPRAAQTDPRAHLPLNQDDLPTRVVDSSVNLGKKDV